jgi:dTMP kinase
LFITLEGIEAVGKTTVAKNLSKSLKEDGYDVVMLRDPGTTKLGEYLRRFLKENTLTKEEELYVFLTAKASLKREIIKHKKENKIIIMDRYIDSTFIYQGIRKRFGIKNIERIGREAYVDPDITFIIDSDVETVHERLYNREKLDAIESELNFKKIQDMLSYFRDLPKQFPNRNYKIINGNQPINKLIKDIRATLGF